MDNRNPLDKTPYALALEQEVHKLRSELRQYRSEDSESRRHSIYLEPETMVLPDPFDYVRLTPVASVSANRVPGSYHIYVKSTNGLHMTYQLSDEVILQSNPTAIYTALQEMYRTVHFNLSKKLADELFNQKGDPGGESI